MRVLVIGGAGFIGSHTVDALVTRGFAVRIVDHLDSQVHPGGAPPSYLNRRAEFIRADVTDPTSLREALLGIEAVFYLAGAIGVGDSTYRIRHYAHANLLGAANFLDILANEKHAVRKVILASSVTVYGEGKYSCPVHGVVYPGLRSPEQVASREWELRCPVLANGKTCPARLTPLPTDEEKPLFPQSLYAITKRTQEEMFFAVGRTYGIPIVVLRYFNVYGPRQALSNPYTGVAKIFAAEMMQRREPVLYEDGLQSRDFVHVADVVKANLLALQKREAEGRVFNIGTGKQTTVREVAEALSKILGYKGELVASNRCRSGDVRHCWADIQRIRAKLGFKPQFVFPARLEDILQWSAATTAGTSLDKAQAELEQRGLIS